MPASSPRPESARLAAWLALRALRKDKDSPLPAILNRLGQRLDPRDFRLLTNLVYGALRTQARLDLALSRHLRKAPAPDIRDLLRLGVYELLWTDIPAHASVDQYVRLAHSRHTRLAKLVNAVLRGLDRDRQPVLAFDAACLAEAKIRPTAASLARLGSLPTWLAALWLEQYGPDLAHALTENSWQQPVPNYRINKLNQAEFFDFFEKDPDGPSLSGQDPRFAQAEAAGLLSRQGESSIQAGLLLSQYIREDPFLREAEIWDACCGRGNKTCALLEAGLKVSLASDPSAARLAGLRENLNRLGLPAPQIQCASLEQAACGLDRQFGVIILDAPCSGSGTLARNPELRGRLTPERLRQQALLQSQLLDQAWPRLTPDGLLAYLTCALNQAENEEQIRNFDARCPDARRVRQEYLLPTTAGGDSIFVALIRKDG